MVQLALNEWAHPRVLTERAFTPFSVGPRQCTGKTLAYAELRHVATILLRHYDIEFADGYDPETIMKDQVTAQPGKVMCVFKPREQ
ncbi:unnamed protein product [Clonostachys rosea f. rosea IK726]|uniref:Uncharacterized protein n=1 Tax=Clonostachys rosea f. rosea IK726 TaxID=1349383 RepID=A0ACA9U6J6_BIOOC|nr:unnamed protein product [Clonostachys rosea f. rosea IK726]